MFIELDAVTKHSLNTEIYSLTGRLTVSETFLASESTLALNISTLISGPYILKVSTKAMTYTQKIIVSD